MLFEFHHLLQRGKGHPHACNQRRAHQPCPETSFCRTPADALPTPSGWRACVPRGCSGEHVHMGLKIKTASPPTPSMGGGWEGKARPGLESHFYSFRSSSQRRIQWSHGKPGSGIVLNETFLPKSAVIRSPRQQSRFSLLVNINGTKFQGELREMPDSKQVL